jgi:hypothetical protein
MFSLSLICTYYNITSEIANLIYCLRGDYIEVTHIYCHNMQAKLHALIP